MFKFIFNVIVVTTLIVWLVPSDDTATDVSINVNTDGLSPDAAQFARAGAEVLATTCPDLARYMNDMTPERGARIGAPLWGDGERRGWSDALIFEFRVSEQPKLIPASFGAGGHVCTFSVNPVGPQAGVSVAKAQCASLCAGQRRTDEQAFFPTSK